MKKSIPFTGVATALITPFFGGNIDYGALKRIIDYQIEGGVDALVIGGTTGEISTIEKDECERLYTFAIDYISGRVPVILGAGSNNTRAAREKVLMAERLGASGALVVTPYYNKGTDEGLKRHYISIADSVDMPIILYNVPARTGVNLSIETISELSSHENIVAIKEASGQSERLVEIAKIGSGMTLYSGNDADTYTVLSLGGGGVISVISNMLPSLVKEMCEHFFLGRRDEALKIQLRLMGLIKSLFAMTNPVPVKYGMSMMGFCSEEVRLPLYKASDALKVKIEEEYNKLL